MRIDNGILKRFAMLGLALMMGVSMSACAGLLSAKKIWKEEVVLHDGKVLVVERTSTLGDYIVPGSSEPPTIAQSLVFYLPGKNKRASWASEFRSEGPEPNGLGVLLLDIVGGIPYLATSPAGCISYNKWSRPNPPYILFKYNQEKWERIPLESFPPELVQANLMSEPPLSLLEPYYTVDQVKARMKGWSRAEYTKTILREALENYGNSCPKMISYGKQGGWIGLDWFTDQPSLEACLKFCDHKKISIETCPCNGIFKGEK